MQSSAEPTTMPEKTLQLSPLALAVLYLGMAGFWGFAILFYLSVAAMIGPTETMEARQAEFYQKVFGGWGIVGFPAVVLLFVFCLGSAAHQVAILNNASRIVTGWLMGAAVTCGLAYCVLIYWLLLVKPS
jgi:hypothetical protein